MLPRYKQISRDIFSTRFPISHLHFHRWRPDSLRFCVNVEKNSRVPIIVIAWIEFFIEPAVLHLKAKASPDRFVVKVCAVLFRPRPRAVVNADHSIADCENFFHLQRGIITSAPLVRMPTDEVFSIKKVRPAFRVRLGARVAGKCQRCEGGV